MEQLLDDICRVFVRNGTDHVDLKRLLQELADARGITKPKGERDHVLGQSVPAVDLRTDTVVVDSPLPPPPTETVETT